MTEKFTPGQRWHPPTAADHNLIADAAEDYRARILGAGGNPARLPPIPTDVIKVRNSSGAQRRAGEALETDVRGLLTTGVAATHLWIDADIPSDLVRWGILRKTLPDGEIGELQLSGVCMALVDIQSITDRWAGPVASSAVLKSAASGPARLLYAPALTGEQDCIVMLGDDYTVLSSVVFRAPIGGIPSRGVNQLGYATCEKIISNSTGGLCVSGEIVIYNVSNAAVDPGKVGMASPLRCGDGSIIYVVTVESCFDEGAIAIEDC